MKKATFLNVIETIVASGRSPLSDTLIEVFIYYLYDVFSIPLILRFFYITLI